MKFLMTLLRMKLFWLGLTIIGLCAGVAAWVLVQLRHQQVDEFFCTLVVAMGMAVLPLIFICYQDYAGKLPLPSDRRELQLIAMTDLISAAPLIIAAAVIWYDFITGHASDVFFILGPAVALWAILRYALRRRNRGG